MTPTNPPEQWLERLRHLYLTKSPDDDGLHTGSITFNWCTFTLNPKEKHISFYLVTQESLESFIRDEVVGSLAQQIEKFIDDNDDGMWAGRETADAILKLLTPTRVTPRDT